MNPQGPQHSDPIRILLGEWKLPSIHDGIASALKTIGYELIEHAGKPDIALW